MNKLLRRSCAACSAAIFLLVLLETSTAAPVNTKEDAWKFLTDYGYVPPVKDGDSLLDEQTAFKKFLTDMQHMAGINQTGEMDEDTMQLMNTPRCAVSDNVGHNNDAKRRKKRYAIEGSRWRNKALSYGFSAYTSQFNQVTQRSIIQQALKAWSDNSALTFTETSSSNNDIQILFAKGAHGDSSPFDGPLGVLAHAYFPSSGGDAHFDDAETWTQNTRSGTNLLQVATHEFGHSLGLGHSSVPSAIMYAYYTGYIPDPQLTSDDITGIQSLYGPPTSDTATTTTTTKSPTTVRSVVGVTTRGLVTSTTTRATTPSLARPAICGYPKMDAIVVVDGITYAFSDSNYFVLNDNGVASGYPRSIASNWPQISGGIDAALYYPPEISRDSGRTVITKEGLLFLYKGSQYWRYKNVNQVDAGYPRDIRTGFPGIPDNIDAVFQWSGNGRIFFIKGSNYYRYNPMIGTDAGYPKPLSAWVGLPNAITAAFQWTNGRTYFFSGTTYYRFDDYNFRVDSTSPAYPRDNGEWWFGCSASIQSGDLKVEGDDDGNQFKEIENDFNPNSSSQLSCFQLSILVAGSLFTQIMSRCF